MKNAEEYPLSILVVGASGATGRLLVKRLVDRGKSVKIIVRSADALPELLRSNKNISIIQASLLSLSDTELQNHVSGCEAVASCLGHNLTFKGVFGAPRMLVTEATRRLCLAIKSHSPMQPVKFVLMNTTGNRNRDLAEKVSFAQRLVVGLIRILLPPHRDNENAADYLRVEIGQNDNAIEWAVVRPDGLIDEELVTDYDIHPSPIRSAIFDAGKTSRINVGDFMAELITNRDTWNTWKGRMPVIYNRVQP